MTWAAYRAPVRVDLAGGTLDLWPLYALLGPCRTVNVAIRKYVRVAVRHSGRGVRVRREDGGASNPEMFRDVLTGLGAQGGWEVVYGSEVPPGSGLGGSSALMMCLLAALRSLGAVRGSLHDLIEKALDLEAGLIRAPTGRQDYIAAVWGGVQAVSFGWGRWMRKSYPRLAAPLEAILYIAPTGVSHRSAAPNWRIVRGAVEGDPRALQALGGIQRAGEAAREACERGAARGISRAMALDWEARRSLGPFVSTPRVDRAIAALQRAGCVARLCGAGAGGTLLVAAPPRLQVHARKVLAGLDFALERVAVERGGMRRVRFDGGRSA